MFPGDPGYEPPGPFDPPPEVALTPPGPRPGGGRAVPDPLPLQPPPPINGTAIPDTGYIPPWLTEFFGNGANFPPIGTPAPAPDPGAWVS